MWYLSLSQLFYISDADDLFGHFFCQPNGKMSTLAKASHHLSKAFPTCGVSLPMEKILWERSVWKHPTTMFEGGNLLNMNLTPVTNISPENSATSWVVRLSCRAIFANISQIYYFIFEGTVSICICLLQVGSVCAQHNMHSMCTHKKNWPFLLEICYCFCIVLVRVCIHEYHEYKP